MPQVLSEAYAAKIRRQFKDAEFVLFRARQWNFIRFRFVGLQEGSWVPLEDFFRALEITPGMLVPLFNIDRISKKIPVTIGNYDALGAFHRGKKSFLKLSEIIGKPIRILAEDDSNSESYPYRFTADGRKSVR